VIRVTVNSLPARHGWSAHTNGAYVARLGTLFMRKLTGAPIAYAITWPIRIVVGIAGMLLGAAGMVTLLGRPSSLFGWAVSNQLLNILETFGCWSVSAFLIWAIFGEKIKSYWHTEPKARDMWTDSLCAMREHKLITACLAFALFGWVFKLVVDLVFSWQ
jgi:hypothetical protein